MLLAINSGQRQGDLLRLPWSAYDGKEMKLRQGKTGAYVTIPVTDELKVALDAAPRRSPIMLTNSEGKPWSKSGFQGAWGKATKRAGIRGLTFHDLRGTAVVMLARAECNEVEIYSITGHKPGDVRAILTAHYLPRDAEVAGNAIAKLNRYKSRGDQTGDENLPTALPTALKIASCENGEGIGKSIGWGAWIRTRECRNQNPVPYHLATPQRDLSSEADHIGAFGSDQRCRPSSFAD